MKKILKNIGEFFGCFLLLAALVVLCNLANGCDDVRHHRHYTKKTQQRVKVYKQHKHSNITVAVEENDNDWIYWYILDYNDTYYYYSSPTYYPPSSYSTFTWSSAKANVESPITEVSKELQPVTEEVVPNDELGQQMEQTIDTSEQQIADMVDEGNSNSGGYDTDVSAPDNTPSPDTSVDTSSSDVSSGGSDD